MIPQQRMDIRLHELRALVLTMAGYIEEMIELSVRALLLRDVALLDKIESVEYNVNSLHKKIDKKCFEILACQSPVASDLRLLLAIVKINVDLERMGDLACNNSFAVKDYLQGSPDMIVQQIKQMASTVQKTVRESFDAFMDKDLEKAKEVLALDDTVDHFRTTISKTLKENIQQNLQGLSEAMSLLSVVRNLERLADHATNVAEDVIFYLTGLDVRHAHSLPKEET